MGIEAKINNYWIAPNAVNITLNALGNENRIQGSVASGAVISCYIESVTPGGANGDGLGLDNGRNPKRWPLVISPTYFNSDTQKYVYAAIPRRSSFSTQAVIVFPSEKIDIYGVNANDEQIGSSDYFYIWLQGIISAPVINSGVLKREWTQEITWGSLGTYEDIMNMSETDWYSYSKVSNTVTFLKKIVMNAGSFFENLFLGDHELKGVATASTENVDSDTLVATPNFVTQHYLRKDADDQATGLIGFVKGLWVKASGLFGFSEDGDIVARSLKALGTSGATTTDIDNATRKNLGLEVSESGVIGGILRVAKNILTKTLQSLNFSGGDSMFGTGWQLTDDDGNGNSRLVVDNLFVRMKAVFNELEVRKFVAMAGNYVFSPAASIIEEVDYIHLIKDGDEIVGEEVLGYEYIKVPWVLRLVPLSLVGKILSRKKMVRSTMSAEDWDKVDIFRCWIKADDGTTRTINTWRVGMLARCQTFDQSQGSGTQSGTWYGMNVTNKLYWRAVTATETAVTKQDYTKPNHILEDGLTHNYIDLANYTDENDVQLYLTGSDRPEAFDNIVCYGDWLDRSLSNLITIETVGSDAPCIREMLGVGYTDGTSIDWSLNGKERTRISPVAGNKFVAPSFVVTTDNGMTGEELYNERYKGVALRYDNIPGQSTTMATDGAIVLLVYSNIETDNALKICHVEPTIINPITGRPSGGGITWTSYKADPGDYYINQSNGHRFVATQTGWEDRGLNDESKSTLKVDINGIETRVSDAEGNISQLIQTAAGLMSMVSQNTLARNILNGVLTGNGWKSGVWDNGTFTPSGDISVDGDSWFIKNSPDDNCFALEGISLAAESYMLSLHSIAVSETGTPAVDYPSITCYLKKSSDSISIITNSGAERRECTAAIQITQALSGNYTLYVIAPKIRFPQLEKGTSVTDFDAPFLEQSLSLILQTADDISLAIINKLGETGINISGNNRSIELRGDKVTFQNSAGTLQSPKIWIESTSGALHADDAVITNATINGLTAQNAYINGLRAQNVDIEGKITANQGIIGPFHIGDDGLYCGTIDDWKTSSNNFAYLHESSFRLGQRISYSGNEIASLKVFIGKDSDPYENRSDYLCDSAMYIYRRMASSQDHDMYKPAVRIHSDNVGFANVALRLDGALQAHGGVIEKGRYLYYTGVAPNNVNTFNLTLGTTFLVKCTASGTFYMPELSDVQQQLGLESEEHFCVRLTIIACKGTAKFYITASSPIYDHDISQWGSNDWSMTQGDVAIVCLCYDGTNYYIQEIDTLE